MATSEPTGRTESRRPFSPPPLPGATERREGFVTPAAFHARRHKAILAAHPELRALFGPRRVSALFVVGLVALQLFFAWAARDLGVAGTVALAFGAGAFVVHALGVLIHDCAHNLVFRTARANKLLSIWANGPLLVPGAIDFRDKHLMHHKHLGEGPHKDFQTPTPEAIRWVGRSRLRKIVWLAVGSIVFPKRPIDGVATKSPWLTANLVSQVAFDAAALALFGWRGLLYLGLSALFAFGPHPVGLRGYAEHVLARRDQPTASYYGLLNRVAFNVGHHVEHHDFPAVAWMSLPRVRRLAPASYEGLETIRSWTGLLFQFVTGDERRVDSYVKAPPR